MKTSIPSTSVPVLDIHLSPSPSHFHDTKEPVHHIEVYSKESHDLQVLALKKKRGVFVVVKFHSLYMNYIRFFHPYKWPYKLQKKGNWGWKFHLQQ